MPFRTVCAALLLAVPMALTAAAEEKARPFEAVGEWQSYHADGKPFRLILKTDHTAATDFGPGEKGFWRWEGETVRVFFTDGWDDVLELKDRAIQKRSWGPGADRCKTPEKSSPVERISGPQP